jgi:hypothetical protein
VQRGLIDCGFMPQVPQDIGNELEVSPLHVIGLRSHISTSIAGVVRAAPVFAALGPLAIYNIDDG